jgi:DNA-binding MurR/RpiR family transcriptional regulator
MSYENRIRENRHQMSKSFTRLADYILDSYIQAALMTATELAHQVDVDAATVVRFAQRLGYSGFPDLQDEIKERVKRELLIRPEEAAEADSITGVVSESMMQAREAVEQASVLLDVKAISQIADKIGDARRIIIIPDGLGQIAAYNLINLLEQGGFLVSVAQSGVSDLARTVSSASTDDLILAIDIAGDAPYIARTLNEANAAGIPTAAIVGAASHQTASVTDTVLASQNQPAFGLGVVVIDAIVYALAEVLRWKYQERFTGADEAIEEIFTRIQVGDK